VKHTFSDILIPQDKNGSSENVLPSIDDPQVEEQALNALIARIDEIEKCSQKMLLLFSDITRRSQGHILASQINNDLMSKRVAFDNLNTIKRRILAVYIPIGEAYIKKQCYEDALRVWENVLRTDPSNEYIHKRLDELLKTQINAN
jgi:hypothetical protein